MKNKWKRLEERKVEEVVDRKKWGAQRNRFGFSGRGSISR